VLRMIKRPRPVVFASAFGFAAFCFAVALGQPAPPERQFGIATVAEQTVQILPQGPLFWRIESFATPADARRHGRSTALYADNDGATWRFTLGPKANEQLDGVLVAPPLSRAEEHTPELQS